MHLGITFPLIRCVFREHTTPEWEGMGLVYHYYEILEYEYPFEYKYPTKRSTHVSSSFFFFEEEAPTKN